jgi:hypothetical protein
MSANATTRRSAPGGVYVVGFRLDGDATHCAVGAAPPQTPLDARSFPPWAALLNRERAHAAVTQWRASVADAMACPDKRLHPHLCNCGKPRERVATPKTDRRKLRLVRQQRLVKQHIRGDTDMHGRVEVAKHVYLSPGIWADKKAPHYMTPHAELQLEGVAQPMAVAAVWVQKIWRGTRGRLEFRREYWKQGMRLVAKSFDSWKGVVQYNITLRRLASARFIQRNMRALWRWRVNRQRFLHRARRIYVLGQVIDALARLKIFYAWKCHSRVILRQRKGMLTLFHLRRHAALNKLFRTMRRGVLHETLVCTWWNDYVVGTYRQRETRARCMVVFKRWLRLCYENNALRTRRMRIMFRAWRLFTKHQLYESSQRQRLWAAGILQREWRCFVTKRAYRYKAASIALINRFFRSTLARIDASRRRRKRYELLLLRARLFAWQKVTTLWRKERVYRENVKARLAERGITEKVEAWSERSNTSGSAAGYLSRFPLAVPARPFPTVGAHVVTDDDGVLNNQLLLTSWQAPLEWAVDRDDLLHRRRRVLARRRNQRVLKVRIDRAKEVVQRGSRMVAVGSGFVFGKMRRALKRRFGGKDDEDNDDDEEEEEEGEDGQERNYTEDATYMNCPPRRLTRTQALRAASDMASRGYLEVLMWLRENGCEWNADVCAEAARGDHLDVLKWAYENGCPADERVAESAAEAGQHEMLQWALERELPKSVPMLVLMASRGHRVGILKFLAATQTGFAVHPLSATAAVLSSEFIGEKGEEIVDEKYVLRDVFIFLFEHMESIEVFTEETTAAAVRRGRLELLKWLRHMKCPWDWRVLTACKQYKQKHILKWVMKHGGGAIRASRPESRKRRSLFFGHLEQLLEMK